MKNILYSSCFMMVMFTSAVIISQELPDAVTEAIKQTTEKCKREIDKAFHSYLEGCPGLGDRSEFNRDYEDYINGHAIYKMDKHLKKINNLCEQHGLSVADIGAIKKDILSVLDHYSYDVVENYLKSVISDDVLWVHPVWPVGEKHIDKGTKWLSHFCDYGFWDGAPHGIRNSNSSSRCMDQWDKEHKFISDTMDQKRLAVENNAAYSDEQRKKLSDAWKRHAKYYRPRS